MRSSYPYRALLALFLFVALCSTSQGAMAEPPPSALLRTPHSGWLWSNPFPQANDLSAVAFAGETGFAVGEEGTILRSLDGGASWTALSSGTTENLSPMQVLDPATVIVSGQYGLRESTDGGTSFKEIRSQKPCDECSSISSFSFLSATSGFVETHDVSTRSDSLLWTETGGASFEARTPVPLYGAEPGQIRFLSSTVGLALASGQNIGRIMRTTDGGRSWSVAYEGHQQLSAVTFATSLIAYVVGEHDTLLRSEDAGATWHPMPLVLPAGTAAGNLGSIVCRGAEDCVLINSTEYFPTRSDVVMRTSDGGRTATAAHSFAVPGLKPFVEAVAFVGAHDAVAVGSLGAIAVSRDGGSTFATQLWRGVAFSTPDESQQPRVRLGPSPLEAFIPGQHGKLATTVDGGHTWRLLSVPTRRTLVDVAFPNRRRGFALAEGGAVFRTDDGGSSWRGCGRVGRAPAALLAPSARVVVVTSEHGVWRSTDSCANFTHLRGTVMARGRRAPLSSLDFFYGGAELTRDHAMFVYREQVLESTDAGATWRLVPHPPTRDDVADVSFLNANVGYEMVGGRIYFTRIRGRSWRRIVSLPADGHLDTPMMSFTSERDGYVAARYADEDTGNIIFRTDDAGRTWIPEQLPGGIGAVTAEGGLAYAVNEGLGLVYVARNGGLAGGPARLSLTIVGRATRTPRALARSHGDVTVHGTLSPTVAGAQIHVSWLGAGGDWSSETTMTDAHGSFSFTVDQVESTTWFVANWNGDDTSHGAGTAPVRLTVRR
jgi:photosystem II stability/assembly factor-like uncharacterized protein